MAISINFKALKSFVKLLSVLMIAFSFQSCSYNEMVRKQENVDAQWAQVENAYQRRADLIPNLVNTVKGAANFERETLEAVIEARAKATSVNIDSKNLNEESLQKFEQSQSGLSSALSRLMVVVEKYPELKANQNFLELQAQLEGTENRITIERKNFNEAVKEYNSLIRSFPNNLFAGMFSFHTKAYFKGQEGSDVAPEVSF